MLVKRHHNRFCSHANWYLSDLDAAKDVVQDCWSIIMNKLGSLRDPNSFSSWAMRIVTRKSIDFLKHNKTKCEKLRQYQYTNLEGTNNEEKNTEIIKLQQAIKSLPNDQQIVLRLFYTQEYSLIEISNILDISVGTVKSRLHRTVNELRQLVERN